MPSYQVQSVESAREQIEGMLGAMAEPESPGFSKACIDQDSVRLLSVERDESGKNGKVVIEMQITDKMTNQLGNLHGEFTFFVLHLRTSDEQFTGGAQATLVDNMTSLVIYLHTSGQLGDPWSLLGVSQSIQILYTAPVPLDSYIDIECSSLSVGKSVAVIQCDIWVKDGKGGKRIRRGASGTHTKVDNSSQAKM